MATVVIALTGEPGAGKSTAAQWFRVRGAALLDADGIVRGLWDGGELSQKARARWGESVFGADGKIDRKAVSARVFADEEEYRWLCRATHPVVLARMGAALPEDGHSSIEKLPDVLRVISEVNRELGKRTHPVLPPPGISITMVDAYEKDNVVPGKVRLLTDFRILPDMGYGEAEEILRNALHGAGIEHVEIRNHFFMPGGEINPDDEFVTRCCEIAGRMEDRTSKPQAFDASCEQCFLMEAGMKAVILGPGSLEQAHTRNEFLEVEQLERAAVIYEEITREILGVVCLESIDMLKK